MCTWGGSGGVAPRASSAIIRGESEPGSKLTRKKNFLWQSATLSRCLNQSSKPSVPMILPMKNTNCPRWASVKSTPGGSSANAPKKAIR